MSQNQSQIQVTKGKNKSASVSTVPLNNNNKIKLNDINVSHEERQQQRHHHPHVASAIPSALHRIPNSSSDTEFKRNIDRDRDLQNEEEDEELIKSKSKAKDVHVPIKNYQRDRQATLTKQENLSSLNADQSVDHDPINYKNHNHGHDHRHHHLHHHRQRTIDDPSKSKSNSPSTSSNRSGIDTETDADADADIEDHDHDEGGSKFKSILTSGLNPKSKTKSMSRSGTDNELSEGSLEDGTMPGYGPLLGSEELEKYLSGRKARVQVTTWNMGSLPPPKEYQLRKLFYHDQDESLKKVDIHVISIQECWPDSDAWEMELQICLGPAFALFHSISFGTLHISIFLRRDLLWFTTEPTDYTLSVRSGRLFKTKGSAGIQFGFFGSRFLFISAHLSAGPEPEREKQRVEELRKIVESYGNKFSGTGTGSSHDSPDVIFLCGDLNFRLSGMTRDQILFGLRCNQISKILERDELYLLFNKRKDNLPKCLEGFQEAASITFRPTYKYDIGTDDFDTSNKKRCPAYTDRIMYKCNSMKAKVTASSSSHSHSNTSSTKKLSKEKSKDSLVHQRNHQTPHHHSVKVKMKENLLSPQSQPQLPTEVVCLAYESVAGIRLSDHKPVYSVFTVQIRPGFDTLPLSGAKFKKDLFTKAAQKRAKFLLERRKKLASTLCTLS